MTTMTRSIWRAAVLSATVALVCGDVSAQTRPAQTTARPVPNPVREGTAAQRPVAGRAVPRAGGPAEIRLDTVQSMVDAWAIVEAQKQLQLSNDQYPTFVTNMTKLQNARRRIQGERRRLLSELRPLVQGTGQDQAITDKVKAIDDLNQQASQELRQLIAELDSTLNPRQRARLRFFEEEIERRKIDMLLRARGRGGAPPGK
jgi:hypothetical protein